MELVDAFRKFLCRFHLPGEPQKIDRIIQQFAEHFHTQNLKNSLLDDCDLIVNLLLSIVLLNSDLHKPNSPHNFTKEKYVHGTKSSLKRAYFPEWYLENIFDLINSTPLSMYTYFTLNLNKFFTDQNSSQASTPAKVLTANALQAYNFFQMESSSTKKDENPLAPILNDHNEGYKFFIAQFWPKFMDFFVLVFNKSSTRTLVEASLACIYNLFELSIAYEFEDAKSTIIVNIVQMTNVISEQSFKNLKDRSLLALLLIFKIIFRKGDFLMDSWTEVIS